MLKKKKMLIILSFCTTFLFLSISTQTKTFANIGLYDKMNTAITGRGFSKDPDGKDISITSVNYKKTTEDVKIKKENEIPGYVSDIELAEKGGMYTRKSLMTYHDFIDLGIADDLRHDIEPERMVWVFTSKFSNDHNLGEGVVPTREVTTVIDGETGDVLSVYNSSNINQVKRMPSPDSNSIFYNKQ
ncbi:hypothetical protein QFZ77_002981 [Paenibacillus sp. V4I3]|uniref:hypothetical protein n=1 Tax=Paenibacillus sp. V4I3 TaxID=3042305 RepID=UPI002781F511|nr:hypothetical protein [Paenibacillus sp. V4I3]MDQ0874322.1 hypothetical protein [Paenibacillus sp. V4I3]